MYSACGLVLILRGVGWCASMYWHGYSGFALAAAGICVPRMVICSCNVSEYLCFVM